MFDWRGALMYVAIFVACLAIAALFTLAFLFIGSIWATVFLLGALIIGGALAVGFS